MGHLVCFTANRHSVLPLPLLTFSEVQPLSISVGFVPSARTLVCVSLCPPGFAKRHAKLSSLLSCLPPCLPAPKASRVVDTHVSSKLFPPSFLTPALVGHRCPPELPTADTSAPHSHSFPTFAPVRCVQLPKQVYQASRHFQGILVLTWQSTSI